jgi:hypothetical protein
MIYSPNFLIKTFVVILKGKLLSTIILIVGINFIQKSKSKIILLFGGKVSQITNYLLRPKNHFLITLKKAYKKTKII